MNEKHHLDAPDNDALTDINQLDSHPELSHLYFEAKKGWDGELMSAEDREEARTRQLEQYSLSIRRQFLEIGLLAPLPPAAISLGAAWLATYVWPTSGALGIIPTILIAGACMAIFFKTLHKMQAVFYQHSLRLGPFLIILWVLLGVSVQSLYMVTLPLHHRNALLAVAYITLTSFLWSVALSFLLLSIWSTPDLSNRAKLVYISLIGIIVVGLAVLTVLLQVF